MLAFIPARTRLTAATIAAVVLAGTGCAVSTTTPSAGTAEVPALSAPTDATRVPVVRAVDGDTLVVTNPAGEATTVRLIGVDTPETKDPDSPVQCFGPQAAARTAELTEGQHVRLELDPSQGETDRYDRTLAYIWLDNGQLLNEQLIAEGYGREYTYRDNPYLHQDHFRATEEISRTNKTGLWGSCAK